jgi:hypothetical protein
MRTRSGMRSGWSAVWALALVAGAPALAHAQQSGLFPLLPIRRERVPCAAEDPIYKLYRREYFGYHPTCWRRFPAGWGCPSPEAPNAAEAFRQLPRDVPPADLGPEAAPGAAPGAEEGEMARPGTRPPAGQPSPDALPPLPGGASPFDLDTKPKPIKPPAADANPPVRPSPSSPAGGDVPGLPPPTDRAPGTNPPGDASSAANSPASEPLLALPDPTLSSPGGPEAPSAAAPPTNTEVPGPAASNAPAQAPRRPGLLSSLFSGRLFRRR